MPAVVRLSTTPIKSTRLHHPESIRLDALGAAGDRDLYLINERGNLFSVGRYGPMLLVDATLDNENDTLTLAFPDGSSLQQNAHAGVEPIKTEFFGRDVTGHVMPDIWNIRLSDYLGIPVRLVRCDTPGDASDVHPVTLMSTASVEELGRQGSLDGSQADEPDGRRFRMLIEIDGCEPHEEDSWNGRSARIGSATLEMRGRVPRCAATTLDPQTGNKDFDTLKVLNRYRPGLDVKMPFGVYADVASPGVISVGDAVDVLI